MSYRYLILLRWSQDKNHSLLPPGLLHKGQVQETSGAASTADIFASETTPVFSLRGRGFVIGHLFDSSGIPITDATGLPKTDDTNALCNHILQNCWGEYLIFQPMSDSGFIATHSPSVSVGLPCIYSSARGFISSDIALPVALGLYTRQIDWEYLREFLTYPFLRTSRTALKGIDELLPGERAEFRQGGAVSEQKWTPWKFVSSVNRFSRYQEAEEGVRTAVLMATRAFADIDSSLHLELSGGLDSSIIAASLRGTRSEVTCFTVVTPDPGSDERQYASAAAAELGSELHTQPLWTDDLEHHFVDLADPVRPSAGPLQYAIDNAMRAAGDSISSRSAFTGAGGDSVFCYLRTASPAADAFKELGFMACGRAIHDLSVLHQCTVWRALRLTVRKLRRSPAKYQRDTTFLACPPASTNALDHPWFHAPSEALPGDQERIYELAGNQMFIDYAPRRAARLLRMPLLSQPVVEACLRTPSWMWISGGKNRAVARTAFAHRLPEGVLNRRSKGTFISYLGGAYQRNKMQIEKFILDGHLGSRGIIDSSALRTFNKRELPPRDRSFTRVLDLCRVENWIRMQHGLD